MEKPADWSSASDDELSLWYELDKAGFKHPSEIEKMLGPDWLIKGWLASSITMLSGKPEAGKSTLARQLVAAVSSGTEFHGGKVESRRSGPVLIVVTDGGGLEEWKKGLDALGVDGNEYLVAKFNSGAWGSYAEIAAASDAKMLVFDNATGALDENPHESKAGEVTGPLGAVADAGCPVLLLVHAAKTGDGGPIGSTKWAAWRRHGLELSRAGGKRTVKRKGNLGDFPSVTFDGSGGAEVEPETRERSEERRGREAEVIEIALGMSGKSQRDVSEKIAARLGDGWTGEKVRTLLRRTYLEWDKSAKRWRK